MERKGYVSLLKSHTFRIKHLILLLIAGSIFIDTKRDVSNAMGKIGGKSCSNFMDDPSIDFSEDFSC